MSADRYRISPGRTAKLPPQRTIFAARKGGRAAAVAVAACVAIALAALSATILLAPAQTASTSPESRLSQAADVPAGMAAGVAEEWMLALVNNDHPMEPYQPELTDLRGDQAVDARCYPDLQRMFDAARAAGLSPKVNSSYRSRQEQQQVLDDAIADGINDGLPEDTARRQALRTVAVPGASEHETGLAIDVTSEQQTWEADNAVHEWMADHSWEYGWILRYPSGKEEITDINYEPWHFRYVGETAARKTHESGQCLEEYLGQA